MKSLLKYFFLAIIVTTLIPLSSCKKGPNDPFISFRSRTSRFAGDWKLTKSTYTVTTTQKTGSSTNIRTDQFDFDGTKVTETVTLKLGGSTPVVNTSTYTYSESWTTEKANTYTLVTVTNHGSGAQTITTTGNWAWMYKDKDAGLKNKEAVIIMPEKTGSSVNGKTDAPKVVILDELRNTTMVTKRNWLSDDGNGVVVTNVGTFTYNQ